MAMAVAFAANAQNGGITSDMLKEIRRVNTPTAADKALANAVAANSIEVLAVNRDNACCHRHIF